MDITVHSRTLMQHLTLVGRTAPTKPAMQVLRCVHIAATKAELALWCTDLTTHIRSRMEAEGKKPGAVVVPVPRLLRVLRLLPPQHIRLTSNKIGHLTISTADAEYTIFGDTVADFPDWPEEEGTPERMAIPASVLYSVLRRTLPVVGNDDLRPVMSGVFVEFTPSGTCFTATDAHRLVTISRTDVQASEMKDNFILRSDGARAIRDCLAKWSGEVVVDPYAHRHGRRESDPAHGPTQPGHHNGSRQATGG